MSVKQIVRESPVRDGKRADDSPDIASSAYTVATSTLPQPFPIV